jgi:hypothetical protein
LLLAARGEEQFNYSVVPYHPKKRKSNHDTIILIVNVNKELPKTAELLTIHPMAANVDVAINE